MAKIETIRFNGRTISEVRNNIDSGTKTIGLRSASSTNMRSKGCARKQAGSKIGH